MVPLKNHIRTRRRNTQAYTVVFSVPLRVRHTCDPNNDASGHHLHSRLTMLIAPASAQLPDCRQIKPMSAFKVERAARVFLEGLSNKMPGAFLWGARWQKQNAGFSKNMFLEALCRNRLWENYQMNALFRHNVKQLYILAIHCLLTFNVQSLHRANLGKFVVATTMCHQFTVQSI